MLPETHVVLETALGSMEITVYGAAAPASVEAFLSLIDDDSFVRFGAFHRAVRSEENDHGTPRIDVIQAGMFGRPGLLSPIPHESTARTGLRHTDGAVSLARGALDTATGGDFFVCIGDQPSLDEGGGRDPWHDGRGFAAFGRVTRGMEVVRAIHRQPAIFLAKDPYRHGQVLEPPIRILRASRTAGTP